MKIQSCLPINLPSKHSKKTAQNPKLSDSLQMYFKLKGKAVDFTEDGGKTFRVNTDLT